MKIVKVTNVQEFANKIAPKKSAENKDIVESILKNVKKNGNSSLKRYERKFSGANISSLRVSQSEIKNALLKVSKH